ncbi:MAG: CapA family protein [Peptoniphilaceae bacterium]
MKKKIGIIIFLLILSLLVYKAYDYSDYITKKSSESDKKISSQLEKVKTTKILATGDIMYHMPLYRNNYDIEKEEYDFSSYYAKVSEYLNGADLVVGNFETTVNPNRKISGHPMFNTPPEALKYLKNFGFDVLSTVNNHSLDTGVEGIKTTIEEIDKAGLKHFGTYKDKRQPLIINSNGIKVAFLGYAEIFNGLESLLNEENSYMVSSLNEELILKEITELKERGVDYIIAYPHWGVEYTREATENQKYFNEFLLKNGVDAVLGSHPHVIQPIELSNINGEEKFTIFSMGNSISNQRRPWINKDGVESGVFVELNLEKNGDKTILKSYNLHPTYVNRFRDEKGRMQSEVILYHDLVENGKYRDNLDDYSKHFVDENYKRTMEVLNRNIVLKNK